MAGGGVAAGTWGARGERAELRAVAAASRGAEEDATAAGVMATKEMVIQVISNLK
jgi:hypothetical protein